MDELYPTEIEVAMRGFYQSLAERQRRRYAAIEAVKLGHGRIRYLARVLDCDETTIRRGKRDLVDPAPLSPDRSRKEGAAASR